MSNRVRPDAQYSQRNEQEYRQRMDRRLAECQKKNERFILTAPDGSKWALEVDNAGALSTTAI